MSEEKKDLTVHGRMAVIKHELGKLEIKKSGHNKFVGFKYHELNDFIHVINELNFKHGINDHVLIDSENNICSITLTNTDNSEDSYTTAVPYKEAEMLASGGKDSKVDAIQRMGSTITYNRRYLYMTAYNIQESDGVDGQEQTAKAPKKETTPELKKLSAKGFEKQCMLIETGKVAEAVLRSNMTEKGYMITEEQEVLLNQAVGAYNLINKK